MANPWITHMMAVKKVNPGLSLKQVMKKAKLTYKKGSPSKSRKGRKDFVTHKGDKVYDEDSHYVHKKRRPYTKKRKSKKHRKSRKHRKSKK